MERAHSALTALEGIEEIYCRDEAAVVYEHPSDRIGDLSVASDAHTALGKSPAKHDLSGITSGLRSHGGRYEEMVPFILSEPLKPEYAARAAGDPRNFDIFDFTVNGTRTK